MTLKISVPLPNQLIAGVGLQQSQTLDIDLEKGCPCILLGANGAGKSSLLQQLYLTHAEKAIRLSAHRQSWINTNRVSMTPAARLETEQSLSRAESRQQALWEDGTSLNRFLTSFFDIMESENEINREIAEAFRADQAEQLEKLKGKPTKLVTLNELLAQSNLPIEISVGEGASILASKNGSKQFEIQRLSDGERSALMVLATVLAAKPGKLFVLDEPERHLHRSIVRPLLATLFEARSDCYFLVSTHDVSLPAGLERANTVLIRDCNHNGNQIVSWDAEFVEDAKNLPEETREAILGGRRDIVFIEGCENSLDRPLYSRIFGSSTVETKATCKEVERAVSGIRGSDNLHWVKAWGIVDNDGRPQDEIEALKSKGIYALPVHSVESIYYHPQMIRMLARRQAAVTGDNVDDILSQASDAALKEIDKHKTRLASRVSEMAIRKEFIAKIPTSGSLSTITSPITLEVDAAKVLADELQRLEGFIQEKQLGALVSRYPIRETGALGQITKSIGFPSRAKYEQAVLKLIKEDLEAKKMVEGFFADLLADMKKEESPVGDQ